METEFYCLQFRDTAGDARTIPICHVSEIFARHEDWIEIDTCNLAGTRRERLIARGSLVRVALSEKDLGYRVD